MEGVCVLYSVVFLLSRLLNMHVITIFCHVSMKKGDLILFLTQFVADIDSSSRVRRAKVTFSYNADNADELTLMPGQVHDILHV